MVAEFVDTNNLGATRMLRAFSTILRPGGRTGSTSQSPAEAAAAPLELALGGVGPAAYGELVQFGRTRPWR